MAWTVGDRVQIKDDVVYNGRNIGGYFGTIDAIDRRKSAVHLTNIQDSDGNYFWESSTSFWLKSICTSKSSFMPKFSPEEWNNLMGGT